MIWDEYMKEIETKTKPLGKNKHGTETGNKPREDSMFNTQKIDEKAVVKINGK
jgi:hypothetical protein